jgi:hypothetical protein
MPGGWKNILGERWVRRPGLGLPADIIEDRLFVPAPVRPEPAGDRLYFHNVAMQFGGEWAKGINLSHAYAGTVFFDGTNILAGSAVQDESNFSRYFPQITKLDTSGAILSSGFVTDSLSPFINPYTTDLQAVSGAAGYVFCATSSNESANTAAPVLFALSADLSTLLWAGTAPAIADDRICDVRPDGDGNSAFFSGWKFNSNRNIGVCHQIDYTGAISRSWYIDSVASGVHTRCFSSAPGDSGSLYLFGVTENGAIEGSLIVKFDSSNAVLWKKCFGGTPYSGSFGFVASTGNIYHAQSSTTFKTVVSKISSAGNVIAQVEVFSGSLTITPIDIINDGSDGAYLLVRALDAGNSDTVVLMRLDSALTVLWQIKVAPTLPPSYPSDLSGGLSTDGDYVYASIPSCKMLIKVSADGIASSFTIGSGGLFEAAVSAAALQTQSTSTTVTSITFSVNSGQFFSMTAAPSGFAIRSSGFTPALVDLSGFVLTGPPRQAQVEGSRFAGGFSVTTPSIYGMDRAAGPAQVDRSFASIASATGRQGVLLGVYVSPPLNANQWIGDGDAALYIADSVSNAALDFTAGAPEVYIWRPSTYSRVGTLHSAAGERYGTPSTSEKVTVARFRPCPIFAKAGDVIVVELWGQVLSTGVPSYTGHAYLDGTTINDADNAAVSNYAANIRFSETLTFDISAHTYEVSITESSTASVTQGAVMGSAIAHAESAPASVTNDGARQVPGAISESVAGAEASGSSAAFSATRPEAATATEEQRGGTPYSVAEVEPAASSSEQNTSSAAFSVQEENAVSDSSALAITAFSAAAGESVAASSVHDSSAIFVAGLASAATASASPDFSIAVFSEIGESSPGSSTGDSVWVKGGAAIESSPALADPSAISTTTASMVDGDGDPWFDDVIMLLHCEGMNGSTNIVDVCDSVISLSQPGFGGTPPEISNSEKAFGSSSLYFGDAGANFYAANDAFDLAGDFTIEGWIYHTSLSSNTRAIMSFGGDVLEIFDNWSLVLSGRFTVRDGAGNETTHPNYFVAGAWQHWAVVRKDGVVTLFLQGVKSPYTPLNLPGVISPQFGYINVGARGQLFGNNFYNGYMDEIRISRRARYTADFQVQTKAFSDYRYTGTIASVTINGGAPTFASASAVAAAVDSRSVLKLKQGVSINESAAPVSVADSILADINHQVEAVSAVGFQDREFLGLAGVVESSIATSLASTGAQVAAVISATASAGDSSGGLRAFGSGVSEQVFSAAVSGYTVHFVVQSAASSNAADIENSTTMFGAEAGEFAAALSTVACQLLGDSGKEYSVAYAIQSAASAAVMTSHSSVVVMLKRDDVTVKE